MPGFTELVGGAAGADEARVLRNLLRSGEARGERYLKLRLQRADLIQQASEDVVLPFRNLDVVGLWCGWCFRALWQERDIPVMPVFPSELVRYSEKSEAGASGIDGASAYPHERRRRIIPHVHANVAANGVAIDAEGVLCRRSIADDHCASTM